MTYEELVFPMYVGVILQFLSPEVFNGGIPHVCGGDPTWHTLEIDYDKYSPCMWG